MAIAWNVPLLAVIYFGFTDRISERTENLLMAGWASMIPVCCILLAYVPVLQRLIFVPELDIATMRPKLWITAAIWFVLAALWIAFEAFGA